MPPDMTLWVPAPLRYYRGTFGLGQIVQQIDVHPLARLKYATALFYPATVSQL